MGLIAVEVPRRGLSRVDNQEGDIDLESGLGITKATSLSSMLTINFDMPTKRDKLTDIVNLYLASGVNPGRLVKLTIPTSSTPRIEFYVMKFAETSLNTEKVLNASNTITLVEAMTNNDVVELTDQAEAFLNGK